MLRSKLIFSEKLAKVIDTIDVCSFSFFLLAIN